MEDCFRLYFSGCPCHITHNAPKNVAKHLHASKLDVENMMFDPYYWFHKSTKRKKNIFFVYFVAKITAL